MSQPQPCGVPPAQLSALVDGALGDAERERVLRHVSGCGPCRREAEELRRVRDLLGRSSALEAGEAPSSLSRRLVDIAGPGASAPLWTRPFDQPGRAPRTLPMRHARRRRRAGTVGVVATVLLLSLTTAGWVAAPPSSAAVSEPGVTAEELLGAAMTELPLASEGLSALVLTGAKGVTTPPDRRPLRSEAEDLRRDRPLTPAEAEVVLRSSVVAGAMLTRSGTQDVAARVRSGTLRAQVAVSAQPGQSTQVALQTVSGRPLGSGSLAAVEEPGAVELITRSHTLTGLLQADVVAGRVSTVLEASTGGSLVARWWVDAETGLLLRTERYDDSGAVTAAAGYTEVVVGAADTGASLAPRLTGFHRTSSLALSEAAGLSAQGWACEEELGGLPLVGLQRTGPGSLHTTYSDGITTVGVLQQHGRLSDPPTGFSWDEAAGAWRSEDRVPAQLVWQSGERVITVSGDVPDAAVWDVMAALPREAPRGEPAPWDRVLSGWQRIATEVRPS